MLLQSLTKILLSTVTLFFFMQGFAQNIRLNGKVINPSNEPVSGATIVVEEAKIQVSADIEGRFSVSLQPGKKYTLTVSSVGYDTKIISEIEVASGQNNSLDIVLEPRAKTGEAVVVKTTRRQESTQALLTFQRSNTALSSGLAADFIRRTPDKNTGEVLKRVSGTSIQDNKYVVVRGLSDRYNSAIINNAQLPSTEPDKKVFSFDVIPSSLIDNVIINKTATPELTGEFAGGLVQINTKDVPSANTLSVGISYGFNLQSVFSDFISNQRNSTDWLGFDNGNRSLPGGFPKFAQYYRALGSTSEGVQQQIELSRLFRNESYKEVKSTALPTQTYNITWGSSKRLKNQGAIGSVVSLVYRNSMLVYDVERRLNEDDGDVLVQLYDRQHRYAVNMGALANFSYVKGRHKIAFKNLFNQLFEDNYYTRSGISYDRVQDINFRSSVLNQRTLYSTQLEGEHQLTGSGIRLRYNGNFSLNWKKQPDLRTSAFFRSLNSGNPFEHNDDDTRRFFSDLKDFSYGANGALSIPFTFAGEKQTLKTGASTLIRIRDFRSRIFRYEPANIALFDPAKNQLPYDQIFAPENINQNGFKMLEFTNNQDKYFGVSILNGMFAMLDNKMGEKIRIVWGVRVENFQQFLTTTDVTSKRVNILTKKWDVLPSFNFTYRMNVQQSVRISASRTVARPEFREIAPFAFFDYEVNYAVNGNPDLLRSSIYNGDIRYEHYPKGGEAITFGVFYKYFDDPIELRLNPSSVLDRRNYTYNNADKAYTVGAEFEVRKRLDFISNHLQNFSLFANLTYVHSQVRLASTTGAGAVASNRPLQGQSPYLVNAGLQYNNKNGAWNGSLFYNRIGQRLFLVGIEDLGFPDIYEKSRDQVDLQVARKILKSRGELKITWADILNPRYYFYENLGHRKAFDKNTDRLFSTYRPGSTVSIGFSYDFSIGKK